MSASPAVSTLEQNKQLTIRWFEEIWNRGNRDVIAQLFAPDGVLYDGATVIRGPAEFEHFYDRLRADEDGALLAACLTEQERILI